MRIGAHHTEGLSAQGLGKSFHLFGRFWQPGPVSTRCIIQDLDVHLSQGETVGLIGRTGAGKTTLARIMGGLCHPDQGSVMLDGEDLYRLDPGRWRLRRSKLRYVFQNPDAALHTRMSVRRILREALDHGRDGSQGKTTGDLAGLCDMFLLRPEWLDLYPRQLSLGQRRRVALARSLANRPVYALLDEPFSGLDLMSKKLLWGVFKSIRSSGQMAILLVSHDVDAVMELCDRVLVMRNGQLVEDLVRGAGGWRPQHPYTQALFELSGAHGDGH
jgi:ABC-type glutathione transport system ATPase component